MSRFVNFNGQVLYKPGGITRINASALTPVGLSATGIVGLVGEADGGAPGAVGGAVVINDPALAQQLFTSGPLADAIRIAFDPSADPRVPGGAFQVIAFKTNQSTQSTLHSADSTNLLVETTTSGSTNTVINGTQTNVTVNQHVGRFMKIGSELRRIVSNTASSSPTYTVSPGFTSAPTTGVTADILNDSMILTSLDYGVRQNSLTFDIEAGVNNANAYITTLTLPGLQPGGPSKIETSPELGGTPVVTLMYVGGPVPTLGTGTITVIGSSTSVTVNVSGTPTSNSFANMLIQFADGTQRLISANTNASPTVITLDSGSALSTAQQTALVGTSVTIRNVTSATASIVGANGVATSITSTVAPNADNLNLSFTTGMTLRQLRDTINATSNYKCAIQNGVNVDTFLAANLDFGTRNTAVDVRFDQAISPATKGNFRADLFYIISWINTNSQLATAVRATKGATEGAEAPATLGNVPLMFQGAIRGISANSDWQTAFDAMLLQRVNHIVPLISQDLTNEGNGSTATFASVAAILSSHVNSAATLFKSERGGYIGMKGTKTALIAQAAALNNTDVALTPQQLTVLNALGTLVTQPEWSSAVAAAGQRSGTIEVGEPLTFKQVKTAGIAQDASWNPKKITDVNTMLQSGIMFIEQTPRGTFRWVRDITTYLVDDNDAYFSGSTRDAVRFIAYDLRTDLENEFIGEKGTLANIANVRERVVKKMQDYLGANIIVNSLDPETGTQLLPGYRKLRVTLSGQVMTIRVEIFPVEEIAFELNDISLQLPRLSA